YSLYLTHIEAIAIVKKIAPDSFWLTLILTWCLSLVLAEILYRCVERPWLRARDSWLGVHKSLESSSPVADTPTAAPAMNVAVEPVYFGNESIPAASREA